MKRFILFVLFFAPVALLWNSSCTHKPQLPILPDTSNYPPAVSNIILNKCSIGGCHNAASYQNAGQLELDTWAHLFNGGASGASVIPYCTSFSPFLYYENTDSALGTIATPSMPISTTTKPQVPLTRAEYMVLFNWIAAGAPDVNGNIAFSANPDTRQKIYITNQGCNLMAVVDAQTKLIMRYIPIGDGTDAAPHDVTVSSDGLFAYVPFYAGGIVQKIDTRKDTVIGSVNVGSVALGGTGLWSIAILSPDNTNMLVSGMVPNGYALMVNTGTMQINNALSIEDVSQFDQPHGLESNATFDTFYATLEYGNIVNKWYFYNGHPHITQISIDNKALTYAPSPGVTPDPHQIQMAPDYSKYFVTCQDQLASSVRVLDTKTDTLIKVIPVGSKPQEMDYSESRNELFVVCMNDPGNPIPGDVGSVYVINLTTLNVDTILYGDFSVPHDVAVDEQDGLLFIVSTNFGGSAHHSTLCGVPGWYTVFDLKTLKADPRRFELTNDPYAISTRF